MAKLFKSFGELLENMVGESAEEWRLREDYDKLKDYGVLKKPVDEKYKRIVKEIEQAENKRMYPEGKNPLSIFWREVLVKHDSSNLENLNVLDHFEDVAQLLARRFDASHKFDTGGGLDSCFFYNVVVPLNDADWIEVRERKVNLKDAYYKILNKIRDILVDFGYPISEIREGEIVKRFKWVLNQRLGPVYNFPRL